MFSSAVTSELLQSNSSGIRDLSTEGTVSTIHESPAWKEWYSKDGIFAGDPRGVALSLCMDGVNPFAKERTTYSMCPMVLTPLNLPHCLRVAAGSMMLAGIIPGKYEPKDTDPYLDILVDKCLELNGTVMQDSFRNESFKFRTDIILHQRDYPGQNKLFHCQGKPI